MVAYTEIKLEDLDEIEEWNEYGELKQNIGAPAPATSKPSSSGTPSKASTRVESSTPAQDPASAASSNPEHPLKASLRQASSEAAQKASNTKSKARATPSTAELSASTLKSLENSGPTGMPPPSGTTDAQSAQAPDTGTSSVQGKADTVPVSSESPAVSTSSLHVGLKSGPHEGKERQVTQHRGSNVEVVSQEEAEELERESLIREEDEDEGGEDQVSEVKRGKSDKETMKEATTVAREAANLPRKKTQEQEAASAEDAQATVAD